MPHWGDKAHLGGQVREFGGESQSRSEEATLAGNEDQDGGISGKEWRHTRVYRRAWDQTIKCQHVERRGRGKEGEL